MKLCKIALILTMILALCLGFTTAFAQPLSEWNAELKEYLYNEGTDYTLEKYPTPQDFMKDHEFSTKFISLYGPWIGFAYFYGGMDGDEIEAYEALDSVPLDEYLVTAGIKSTLEKYPTKEAFIANHGELPELWRIYDVENPLTFAETLTRAQERYLTDELGDHSIAIGMLIALLAASGIGFIFADRRRRNEA